MLGFRTAKGLKVSAQTFHAVLRNPIYAGLVAVPTLGVTSKGDFAPLVSLSMFDRVQALLVGKAKAIVPHARNNPDFPLRRFVKCGNCQTPLTGSWSTGRNARYAYYHCRACKVVKVRREHLESRFVALLERLRPDSGYLRLFRAIVLDVWKQRQAEGVATRKTLARHVEEIRQRLDRVEEAFIQTRSIDRASYERQRDKLREELALAEITSAEAKLEELDVEGVLAFAEHVLGDSSRLWSTASLDQKQRLQNVLFPEGLQFDGMEFGTAVTCLAFKQLPRSDDSENGVASLTGLKPAHRYRAEGRDLRPSG